MSASESRSAVVLALAEEFLERYRQGQRPSLKEYIDRHPELAAEIKEVFPAMALMENVALTDESLTGDATGPTTLPESTPPQQLGDYRILREVGRGGMGIVYEAEQVSLGRHVALKVLPRQMFIDDGQRRRFEREAKAAAKLHHTNIVPVFGVGEHDGLPYYVMQFIQGLGLDDVLAELKRLTGSSPAVATGGELRVSRKDVSAADVARSLLTGMFPEGERGCVSAPNEPVLGALTQPRSPESKAMQPRSPESKAMQPRSPESKAMQPRSPESKAMQPRSPESSGTGKLSDSFTLSSSMQLPGSGIAAYSKGKKTTYWQSVAQIGVQVAQALEYAHKQGIQHRDIKPSNLLLDTYGTVWVTDFGLARADNEDHLTQTGDIVGTLRYMPPEAFEGRQDKRGDIYSLGLTLYELLALKPAYEERDRHRLIKRVTTEEPPSLDKLNRSIPRDLVTIVHKAIDRETGRRYQTAGELAADLQRFLDDEPIQARRISSAERLARWCRHHPGVATLTGILALLLIGITAVSLLTAAYFDQLAHRAAQAAENERLARQEAEQAKEREAKLRQQSEEAKRQAEQQKQRAEAGFAKARKAVDDYFTTISESQLLQVPGMQLLRRELLQSALTFYQDFLKERGDDLMIQGELAAAYLRVGKIRGELGEHAQARKADDRARTLYETLTKAAPESVEWRHGLAQCYYRLGRYDEAIALWQKLVQSDQPRFQRELAAAYNNRANNHGDANRLVEALQDYQQSLAIREMLVRLNPEDLVAQRDLGSTLNNLGWVLAKKGRLMEALAMYRRAVEHDEIAFAQAPQDLTNGRSLTMGLNNIAGIERQLGHAKEALAAYGRAVEIWRRMARDNPAVPSLHSGLFNAYRHLWYYQRWLQQNEQAERTMKLAREVCERLPSDGPLDLYNLACFRALNAASLPQDKEKEKPTAEDLAEQKHEADLAMEALRKAVDAGWRNLDHLHKDTDLDALRGREDFKALEADLAARLATAPADKLQANQQALAHRQKAAQADPHNKRLRADLAASQHALALIQLDLGKVEEVHKHLQQAITLREALVQDEPTNVQYQTDLTLSRFALGDIYWQTGRLAEAAKSWQRDLDALETATRQGRDRSSLTHQLLAMRRTVGQHYARAGLWTEAAAQYSRLIQEENVPMSDYFRAACLALRAGDVAAYRRVRERMVQRSKESQELPFAPGWHSWAEILADDGGPNPSAAIERIQTIADKDPSHAWLCHLLGLAHYRAGQFVEAIAQASNSNTLSNTPQKGWPAHIANGPVLAMAHHRLGHAAEAHRWLEKSREEWRRLSPLMHSLGGMTVFPSTSWHWSEAYAWQDWPTFEILLREASVLITGAPSVEEAYDHAHRSLLYHQLGKHEKAEAEWQAAIKRAPQQTALWLARGRAFAQLGQPNKADADFAKVASWTPDELNTFIEAGWWVVGPYPEDLKLPCPPEKNPDPSRPVATADGSKELRWQSAPTGLHGRVDLQPIFNADHSSVYALTYVYSPDERTATLLVGGDDLVRVWLNGRLVHETIRRIWAPWDLDRVPVTLKAGRNVLLAKVHNYSGPHYLYLRLADNLLDRAWVHAWLGLWDEAAAESARGLDRQPSAHDTFYRYFTHAQLVTGDTAAYRRYLNRMFEDKAGHSNFDLAYAGGLLEDATKAKRLVELAEYALEHHEHCNQHPELFHVAGIAHYRAGQFEQAIGRLEESWKHPAWQGSGGHASELGLALAHHRLGHAQEARQWLDKAEQWYEEAIQGAIASPTVTANLCHWPEWPSFVVLRREAHKVIRGKDLPDDPRLKKLTNRTRDWLKKRDKATLDYDVALFLSPNEPRLLLARGQRLAELKRIQEAEADVAKAVEWLGDKAEPTEPATSEADKLFARLAADVLLKKLTTAIQDNPEDMGKRWQRGEWYARHWRWKEAAADFTMALERQPTEEQWWWLHAAPALVAASDHEGYHRFCRKMLQRFSETKDLNKIETTAKVCLLLPASAQQTERACELADQVLIGGKRDSPAHYSIFCQGLANYRRRNYRAAIAGLGPLVSQTYYVPDLTTACHLVLAMAHHRRGEAKAAREHLARGVKLLDQFLSESTLFPAVEGSYSHDWLIAWLLHREAQALIEGKKAKSQK